MTTFRKDLAATVATMLAVLTYVATHEGWDVWLIGDSHHWAAAVISLLGLVVFVLERRPTPGFTQVSMVAALFALLALISGALTPLSFFVVTIVGFWFASVLRDAWTSASPAGNPRRSA
jgi:hypothetical protein